MQVTNKNLKYKNKLKFDFYLHDYKMLIEYDGQQHFNLWNNKNIWNEEQFKRDQIKNQFILDRLKYSLIRIRYFNQNINRILELILLKNKVPKNIFFIQEGKVINNPELPQEY